jgi:serine/threonine protein kinase
MTRKYPSLGRRACGWFLLIQCHAKLPLAVGFQRPSLSVAFQPLQQEQLQQHHHHHHHHHRRRQTLFAVTKEKVPFRSAKQRKISQVSVGELVGSGSYGTVHLLNATLVRDDDNNKKDKIQHMTLIGKRPWKAEELLSSESLSWEEQDAKLKTASQERATRCSYYWSVEEHCFSKLPPHPQLPPYFGTNGDWMLFGLVGDDGTRTTTTTTSIAPAPTLSDLMKLDQNHPQDLTNIAAALGCDSYPATCDRILESLLTVLDHVHTNQIVHRDVKPSNVLVHNGTLILMDFGSAADLEPSGNGILKRRRGLENGSRVAVSPIYCAPEIFVEANYHPTKFDIFSTGLLMCQLLFAYLDERTDAGFHQQFKEVDWDLNLWLSNELAGKVRPQGLPHALEYLGDRPGLWTLLQDMLSKDPGDRPSAIQALQRLEAILKGKGHEDGPFFTMVIESMDACEIPTMSQPLQFVATFTLGKSLGLELSEMDDNNDDDAADDDDADVDVDGDDTVDEASRLLWKTATSRAVEGEVFIKEIVQGGQADELGILEIGDRLQGVGEFPFYDGGFERAVRMVRYTRSAFSSWRRERQAHTPDHAKKIGSSSCS